MATIEILGWKENHIGWTGWDNHAKTELAKRLRRAVNTSPKELRRLLRHIKMKQVIVLAGIDRNAVESVRQILETMGAKLCISLDP